MDTRLGSASHHDIGVAHGDEAKGVANGVGTRGTGCGGGMVWALETILHGDMTSSHVDENLGHKQWRYLSVALHDLSLFLCQGTTGSPLAQTPDRSHKCLLGCQCRYQDILRCFRGRSDL